MRGYYGGGMLRYVVRVSPPSVMSSFTGNPPARSRAEAMASSLESHWCLNLQ